MKKITLILLMAISVFSFAQLSGTYTIGGTSPDYTTINDAVNDLITQGISNNTIFNIRPGTYNEQIMIPRINGTENLRTIKFQSETNNADDVIITYSPTTSTDNYTVLLDNSRNIIFMFLTFTSGGTTSGYSKIITMINGSYGFNFFANKVIGINDTEAEISSRLPFSTSPNSIDTVADIEENYFSGSYKGYLSLNKIENLTFSYNTMIDDCSTWDVGCSISEISGNYASINKNEITGHVNINYCTVSEFYIQQNKFIDGDYCRIYFASSDSVYFINNFLIKTRLVLQSSSNINIYHNSSLTENGLENIYVYDNAIGIRMKNNNFIQRDGEYGTYCVKIEDLASISQMDYNNLFSEGGSVVHIGTMYLETTADWFAVSGFDEHSYTNNVNYIDDSSDLHLCETNLEMTGIGGLATRDYDNVLRSTIAPTVGAFEFSSYIPILNLGENSTICKGTDITLDAGIFQTYQWNNGASLQTITVSDTGNYVVTITDGTSCHISDSIQISNFDYYLELGNDTTICDGDILTLNAGNFISYTWNDMSTNQMLDVSTQGQYTVEVIDTNSCTYTDTINIDVTTCSGVNELGETYNISVYPNPAQNQITIINNNIVINNLQILDITGKILLTQQGFQSLDGLDISFLQNGVYFIKINNTEILKFIKQ